MNLLATLQCAVQVSLFSKFLFDPLGSVISKLALGAKCCWDGITGVGDIRLRVDKLSVKLRRIERELNFVKREHDMCKSQKELLLLHLQEICKAANYQRHSCAPGFSAEVIDGLRETNLIDSSETAVIHSADVIFD
jgi:hypothetical protein